MQNRQSILMKIKKLIEDKDSSAEVWLYGSRARGNSKHDSDWDLLILLNRDMVTSELEQEITNPLFDLEFETGEIISPQVYSLKEWNTKFKVTPFFKNVMKEGRKL